VKSTGKRYLIVNADDFGQSSGVDRVIIEAHERGIVTSASLMVRWPGAAEAAAYSWCRPQLSLGLHVDLGEWAYTGGAWIPLYKVAPLNDVSGSQRSDSTARGFPTIYAQGPIHIDSRQHVHQRELQSILMEVASRLGVSLCHFSPEVCYCGDFYGQTAEGSPIRGRIAVEVLIQIISRLTIACTELSCPPRFCNRSGYNTATSAEEVKFLCDPRLRTAMDVMNVELRSFENVTYPRWKHWPESQAA
jgi:chitin disaccharide deacetylase